MSAGICRQGREAPAGAQQRVGGNPSEAVAIGQNAQALAAHRTYAGHGFGRIEQVFQGIDADPAGAVVDHLLHAALADAEHLDDDAGVVLGHVDGEALHRLVALAVDHTRDDLRLTHGQFEALAAHGLDEHGQLQLAAALHLPGVRAIGRRDA